MALHTISRHDDLLILVAFLFPILVMGASPCFYPNGDVAPSGSPCNPNSDTTSPCCDGTFGAVCLENGLCIAPQGNLIRGSCTDRNWGEGCTHFCLGEDKGGTDLISCANVTGIDTVYCCDHQQPYCCDRGVARITVLPPQPSTSATWNTRASLFDVVAPSHKSSSTPTTSSPSSVSDQDSQGSITGTGPTTTAGGIPQPTNPESSQQGLSSSASVGLGVGVGLGASALAFIAYLAIRRHRSKKASRQGGIGPAHHQPPAQPYSVVDGSVRHKSGSENWRPTPEWQTSLPPHELSSRSLHEIGPSPDQR
ncbi:hypothetical protein PG993_009352 [Apiospora rasikravindrae]|uniref:Uncharacterized protein n=1 Tax=Apiospora rasikravindrae TaxID=990691 RepID=A0ABR1SJK7_9PEZI